jgi:DNA-binding XRE family transcriptional regulator
MRFKDRLTRILSGKKSLEKVSASEIARQLGVERSTVSSWKLGKSEPSIDMIHRLAEVLNVSVSELVGEDEKIEYVDLTKWGVLKVIGNVPAGVAIEAMDSPENCSTVYSCRQQRELSDREAAVLSWPLIGWLNRKNNHAKSPEKSGDFLFQVEGKISRSHQNFTRENRPVGTEFLFFKWF